MKNLFLAGLISLFLVPLQTLAADSIGVVKTLNGQSIVGRSGQTLAAELGMQLYMSDVLHTNEGTMGIILNDDSIITLGKGSTLTLDNFVYQPEQGLLKLAIRFILGKFSYLSGEIAKLSPQSVELQTPESTIAVRGTHVLVEILEQKK